MQYILIQTTPEQTTREVQVLTTQNVAALTTSQVGGIQTPQVVALTTTQIESFVPSGVQMYQCVEAGVVTGHKALDGTPTAPVGGTMVIDALPPTPTWAPEYTGA